MFFDPHPLRSWHVGPLAAPPTPYCVFGTSPRRVSTIVWAISGAFAAATAILSHPLNGTQSALVDDTGQALAEVLLLRVLIASLLARMRSLPGVLGAGVAVGVVEKVVRDNVATTNQTIVDLFMFLAVLVVVLWLARSQRDESGWSLSPRVRPVPERLRRIWWVRHLNHIGFVVLFGALVLLLLVVTTNARPLPWTVILLWAMVALSLTILTGGRAVVARPVCVVGVGRLTTVALSSGTTSSVPLDLFELWVEVAVGPGDARWDGDRRSRSRCSPGFRLCGFAACSSPLPPSLRRSPQPVGSSCRASSREGRRSSSGSAAEHLWHRLRCDERTSTTCVWARWRNVMDCVAHSCKRGWAHVHRGSRQRGDGGRINRRRRPGSNLQRSQYPVAWLRLLVASWSRSCRVSSRAQRSLQWSRSRLW